MKKLIAIFFLSLLCLVTISGEVNLCDSGYELVTASEFSEKEAKDGKNEVKEFMDNHSKNSYVDLALISTGNILQYLISPHPVPDKPTPPPDTAC